MALVRSKFGLSGPQRLRKSHEFSLLRQSGKRAVSGCLVANWRSLDAGQLPRLGVIASRRIGSAVVRNRAKRLLREAFRLHQHELACPLEMVLIARGSIVGRDRGDVERDLLRVLRTGGLIGSV